MTDNPDEPHSTESSAPDASPSGDDPGPDTAGDASPAPRSRERDWPRYVIFGAAALALLLVGATVGLLVARSTEPDPSPQPGPVDVGFAQDMSVHHLQAVTMANWARDHSDDPAIRQLAFDIANTQTEQIGRMKGWLMLWGKPEEPAGEYMTWMKEPMGGHDHDSESASESDSADSSAASAESESPEPSGPSGGQVGGSRAMPGMATEQELSKMRSLSGTRLDVYFLQLMLRHHEGGVGMAEYGREHASVSAVSTLATSMLASQRPESHTMRDMLAERDAKPLPFP